MSDDLKRIITALHAAWDADSAHRDAAAAMADLMSQDPFDARVAVYRETINARRQAHDNLKNLVVEIIAKGGAA